MSLVTLVDKLLQYIWELELHPGISPTLIHTENYDLSGNNKKRLCIWK